MERRKEKGAFTGSLLNRGIIDTGSRYNKDADDNCKMYLASSDYYASFPKYFANDLIMSGISTLPWFPNCLKTHPKEISCLRQ
jgi:hypothetical protein